jgi:hypothetical protein
MTRCATRGTWHRRKTVSLFAASNEPPYGISMPGAGAVHHINRRHQVREGLNISAGDARWFSQFFAGDKKDHFLQTFGFI